MMKQSLVCLLVVIGLVGICVLGLAQDDKKKAGVKVKEAATLDKAYKTVMSIVSDDDDKSKKYRKTRTSKAGRYKLSPPRVAGARIVTIGDDKPVKVVKPPKKPHKHDGTVVKRYIYEGDAGGRRIVEIVEGEEIEEVEECEECEALEELVEEHEVEEAPLGVLELEAEDVLLELREPSRISVVRRGHGEHDEDVYIVTRGRGKDSRSVIRGGRISMVPEAEGCIECDCDKCKKRVHVETRGVIRGRTKKEDVHQAIKELRKEVRELRKIVKELQKKIKGVSYVRAEDTAPLKAIDAIDLAEPLIITENTIR